MSSAPAPSESGVPGQQTGGPEPVGSQSLESKAKGSALWTIAGYGGAQVLRLISNLILTRLLAREVFGLMALVTVFQTGLVLFSDIGIRPSIVQNERGDDPPFINTAWTIQVGRGGILWLIAVLLAVPFAGFYDEPMLSSIIPLTGIGLVLNGLDSTKLFTMHRHLAMGRVTIIEIASQVATLIATIAYALVSPTVWAVVFGGNLGFVLKMLLSHVALPGVSNRLFWEKKAAQDLFRFGRWIFLSTLLTFLSTQTDRAIFGKLIPLAMLGVYSIGSMMATVPSVALGNLAQTVTLPLYSRVFHQGEDVQPVFIKARRMMLLLGGWAVALLVSGGPSIIHTLYSAAYFEAGWIVSVLAIGAWFSLLEATNSAAILAKGRAGWNSASSVGKIVGMAVLIPVGFSFGDFTGAVMGYAASDLLKLLVSSIATRSVGLRATKQDLGYTALIALSAGAAMGAVRFLPASIVEGVASSLHGIVGLLEVGRAAAMVELLVVSVVVTLFWLPLAWPKIKGTLLGG
jgi:O-antigen/teichoic acid export membrane protein